MTKPTLIITGATGFIGQHVLKYFQTLGYPIIALVRAMPESMIVDVRYELFDMAKPFKMFEFQSEAILIHLAYTKDNVVENIKATSDLLNQARQKNIKQCVFLSSLSVDSNSGTAYSIQKKEIEKMFKQVGDIILRPGLVLGAGGLFENSISFIKRYKVLPVLGNGSQPVYYIDVDDLVKCMHTLIEQKSEGVFYALNEDAYSYTNFYKEIAKQLHIKLMLVHLPIWIIKPLMGLYSLVPGAKINSDNIKGLEHAPQPDVNILAQSKYNFKFKGLHEILKSFKG